MRWLAVCLAACVAACASPGAGPYSEPAANAERHTARAEALSRQAADLMGSSPEEAERLLREALTADIFFGPAHNNLGVLYLKQDRLYEAAGEFEWARKLMSGHPDPRFNLAMTLERAGQVEEALATYTAALEVYEGYLPAIQGLASLTIRSGGEDERLGGWLREIAIRAEEAEWRAWAERERAGRDL